MRLAVARGRLRRRRRDSERPTPPTGTKLPTSIGKGEGQLNLIAWEGYTQPEWVKPFEQQTGCKVHAQVRRLLRRDGDADAPGRRAQYDMVSASGDASLRLIRGGDVQPMNVNLIPDWKNFIPQLQSPPHNTVDGKHYGISLQWGPNTLLYNTKKVTPAPTSWAAIYDPKYKGEITVPDNPIQIADAALYLSKTQPEPRHHRPVRADRGAARRGGQRCSSSSAR